MTGGGLLRPDKYHTRKVCQERISAQDLIDGEYSSILAFSVGLETLT